MEVVVETLIVDEHRIAHIGRHNVTVEEAVEIVSGDHVYIEGHDGRWRLIGQTAQGRFLTIVVGARESPNTYGLVTARPARREERSFYHEFIREQGGETDGED